jgi:hypothetical protein
LNLVHVAAVGVHEPQVEILSAEYAMGNLEVAGAAIQKQSVEEC